MHSQSSFRPDLRSNSSKRHDEYSLSFPRMMNGIFIESTRGFSNSKDDLFPIMVAKTRAGVIIASSSSRVGFVLVCWELLESPRPCLDRAYSFNPLHVVPLMEVVPYPGTVSKYTDQATQFNKSMG